MEGSLPERRRRHIGKVRKERRTVVERGAKSWMATKIHKARKS